MCLQNGGQRYLTQFSVILLQIFWASEQQDFENDTRLDWMVTADASVTILSLSVLFWHNW